MFSIAFASYLTIALVFKVFLFSIHSEAVLAPDLPHY